MRAGRGVDVEVAGPDGPIGAIDWGGTGPPILLLHGGGANAAGWAPVVPHLAGRHRCISFDSYGHGRTPARQPSFEAFLDEIDAVIGHFGLPREELALVGSSFGGALAVWYGSVRPGVRAIVGVDSAPTTEHIGPWPPPTRADRTPDQWRAAGWGWSGDDTAYEAHVAALVADGEPELSARRAHQRGPDGRFHTRPDPEFLTALSVLGSRPDNPVVRVDNYARLRCPTLMLCATYGNAATNREFVDEMPQRFPMVSVVWLEGPHALDWHCPDVVARHVTKFLAR